MGAFNPFEAIIHIVQFIVLLTFHEWAHAKSANMLGDPTARSLGRMSLNPAVHIDILGTIILPLIGSLGGVFFGWAKPVPVDPRNLRQPKRDMMLAAAMCFHLTRLFPLTFLFLLVYPRRHHPLLLNDQNQYL